MTIRTRTRLGAAAGVLAAVTGLTATSVAPAVAAGAHAARAKSTACSPLPKNTDAPHILSPCNGAKLTSGKKVTFKVYDGDAAAASNPPYILISAKRTLSGGHLAAPPPLGGDFHVLTSEAAAPTEFDYTSPAEQFPRWWENTPGTYYVQIRQADARAGKAGRYYSPITTVRVG